MKRVRLMSEVRQPVTVEQPANDDDGAFSKGPRDWLDRFAQLAGGTAYKVPSGSRGTSTDILNQADIAGAFDGTGMAGTLAIYAIEMLVPSTVTEAELCDWLTDVIGKRSKCPAYAIRKALPYVIRDFVLGGTVVNPVAAMIETNLGRLEYSRAYHDAYAVAEEIARNAARVAWARIR